MCNVMAYPSTASEITTNALNRVSQYRCRQIVKLVHAVTFLHPYATVRCWSFSFLLHYYYYYFNIIFIIIFIIITITIIISAINQRWPI